MKKWADRWAYFAQYMKEHFYDFQLPCWNKSVQQIDLIVMDDRDNQGSCYEYMLSKISIAGQNGTKLDPRHIIKMMVDMCNPKETEYHLYQVAYSWFFDVTCRRIIFMKNHD